MYLDSKNIHLVIINPYQNVGRIVNLMLQSLKHSPSGWEIMWGLIAPYLPAQRFLHLPKYLVLVIATDGFKGWSSPLLLSLSLPSPPPPPAPTLDSAAREKMEQVVTCFHATLEPRERASPPLLLFLLAQNLVEEIGGKKGQTAATPTPCSPELHEKWGCGQTLCWSAAELGAHSMWGFWPKLHWHAGEFREFPAHALQSNGGCSCTAGGRGQPHCHAP